MNHPPSREATLLASSFVQRCLRQTDKGAVHELSLALDRFRAEGVELAISERDALRAALQTVRGVAQDRALAAERERDEMRADRDRWMAEH